MRRDLAIFITGDDKKMKVVITKNFEETCKKAADIIIGQVQEKPDCRLGLATGSTAAGIYPYIVKANKDGAVDFSKVSTVNLDEYVGIDPRHPESYRSCMNRWLFDHINIDKAKTVVASAQGDPDESVKVFNKAIAEGGPIDLQLLGVGLDGHIGFNEPGEVLYSHAHREKLTDSTIEANSRFFDRKEDVPTEAISMGMGDILKARKIVFAAGGENKVEAIKRLLTDDAADPQWPVTFLKLHADVTVIIDEELAKLAGYKN
jgi:glucosamine-6-phosphate deaminase